MYNRLVGVVEFLQVISFRTRPDLADATTLSRDTLVLPTARHTQHHRALQRYFNRTVDTYAAATVSAVAQNGPRPFLDERERTAQQALKFAPTLR